jgi:hypothetical protein
MYLDFPNLSGPRSRLVEGVFNGRVESRLAEGWSWVVRKVDRKVNRGTRAAGDAWTHLHIAPMTYLWSVSEAMGAEASYICVAVSDYHYAFDSLT